MQRFFSISILLIFAATLLAQHADSRVFEDLIETIAEQNPDADLSEIEEQLYDLAQHTINLNVATQSDLEQLFWLTPEQRDHILLYVYHHPMKTIYELQLIPGLQDYEIRNLLPFITVLPVDAKQDISLGEAFRAAAHELLLRTDARNLERFNTDPAYVQLRYSLQTGDKLRMGAVLKRDAGEIPSAHSRYGAYLEIHDIWRFKTVVAGDYQARFGLGLVMNAALPMGKSQLATNIGYGRYGLSKYSGVSDGFLRGAGATLRVGHFDLSAFYSMRIPMDSLWQQTAGLNLRYAHNRFRIGLTALHLWAQDSLLIRNNYYNANYFRGQQQFAASLDFQYAIRHLMLFGEIATAQNNQWGCAAMVGARYLPATDCSLLLLGRYFSPHYDAYYASTFSEGSRVNDEQGIYLGMDMSRIRNWRLSAYADFFFAQGPKYQIRSDHSWGYDLMAQALFLPSDRFDLQLRLKNKRKGDTDKYSLRVQTNNHWRLFSLRLQADASLARKNLPYLLVHTSSSVSNPDGTTSLSASMSAFAQLEYRLIRLPLTFQFRLQGFYVPDYTSRIYTYENDVLYAFSIPMVYGVGARYFLNIRYRISDHLALYFRASDTWYSRAWAAAHNDSMQHKTDLHLLLRWRI